MKTILTLLFVFWSALLFAQDRQQVAKFSHGYHLMEIGAECADCHTDMASSNSSADNNLPLMDNCFGCHDDSEDNCTQCHSNPDEVETWANPQRTINFSHEKHLGMDDVECATCHQGLEKVNYAQPENLPAMATCLTCHDGGKAPSECAACHQQSLAELRPANHSTDWKARHGSFARMDEENCLTCHSESTCQQCHEGASLLAEEKDATSRFAPFNAHETETGGDALVRESVHDLNFRYTHPIAARNKTLDCATCHTTSEFCSDCHLAEGVGDEFMPQWHRVAGFATVGVRGSGGGAHAERARKDIESCISCHDDQGDDPICLQCHMDITPGLGNDPKTHADGFTGGLAKGDWHDDKNSVCFNCHQDTGQKGLGFCGYCHQ